ncbi:MAG: hypothetical protein NW207_09260 [Cytophagales bacterium]|nr:hypothetical protein [Cytophagales bacterium]
MSVTNINLEKSIDKKKESAFKNPFPGLRPFNIEESHLFFGREGQSDEVLRKLSQNRFVAIIGSSGSGKSSFVYCGVIPILYGGFLTNISSNWDVIVTRPGGGPIDNMAEAIIKRDKIYKGLDNEEKRLRKTIIATLLRSSSLGLSEAVSKYTETENKNILIIVDQFEELFRFKKNEEGGGSSESLAFVNLLVEAIQSKDSPIFIAITMRSDFIGDCSQFPQLTKLINNSNYLIPQMTRDQKRMAITGPVSVGGAKITPRLLQQLLSDLGDNPDQLPIMAHSLMRTWDYWGENHEKGEPLDLPHYEAIGSMSGALSQHANEAYDELSAKQKEVCAIMFKCLTEKTGDSDGIRRPTRVSVMANIAGCSADDIIRIVEVFRRPGRSLLTPSANIQLNDNSIIDISHESLMRIWVRLKNWVDEEGQAVDMYLRLSDAAAKYQVGKAGMWRPPDLQLALNWQEKNNPTLEWAQRYNPAFERTMVFLESSKKAFETEQKVKEELQRKRYKQQQTITIIFAVLTVLALGAFVWAFQLKTQADAATSRALEKEKEATNQALIAKKNADEANKQRAIALEKEKEAQVQADEAHRQAELAKASAAEANTQKAIALVNEKKAKEALTLAEQQRQLALLSEQKALEAQKIAERNETEALKQRMLSIAQAMAVKSLQIHDTTTRALVAQQSYIFNKDYLGNPHNHDVYDALYYAVKNLYHDHHNSLKGHTDAVRSIAFAPNGKQLYTAGSDGKLINWTVNDETFTATDFITNTFMNRILSISNDGKMLALAGDVDYLQLFNLSSSEPNKPKRLYGHKGKVFAMIFTPDNNNLITSGSDTSILVRDLANDKYFRLLRGVAYIKALAIEPKGEYIFVGDESGIVNMLKIKDKDFVKQLPIKNLKKIRALSISPDGRYLAIGDEVGSVKVWSLELDKLVANLSGHRARINDLKFDPQSKVLATASFDGSVRLWDIEHLNEQPIVLRDHNSWVWSVAFSPDGDKIITGCVDNLIRYYPANIERMAMKVCGQLKRNMSPDEWNLYVAKDIKYEETCEGLPVGRNKELE